MMVDVSKVLPGWRGTDPDGGTWVRVNWTPKPWWYVSADGETWDRRTQKKAEAAGLVPLGVARAEESTTYDEAVSLSYWLADQLGEHVDAACDRGETLTDTAKRLVAQVIADRAPIAPAPLDLRQVATAEELDALPDGAAVVDANGVLWQQNGHINLRRMWDRVGDPDRWDVSEIALPALVVWAVSDLLLTAGDNDRDLREDAYSKPSSKVSVPAPLDPGNPEHPEIVTAGDLRWFAGVLRSRAGNWGCLDASHPVVAAIRAYADRLDRERAEAEQDAADRKLATERARAKNPAEWETLPEFDQNTIIDMVMTGIRAADERAGRACQEVGQ